MTIRRMLVAGLATTALTPALMLAATGTASAAGCTNATGGNECYAETIAPASFAAGSTGQFTFTLKYEGDHDAANSANVVPPSGYTVTHVDQPARGTATVVGNTIQLRRIATGTTNRTLTVTFTASTPSQQGAGTWSAPAYECSSGPCSSSDVALDVARSSLTTTGGAAGSNCSASDVSCGTNFIDYSKASSVSTGSAANATAWLVGTISFPATPATGGQLYSMDALGHPGNCPSPTGPAPCTFEMRTDAIPAPYDAAHPATLTLLCDQSHCSPSGVPTVFKRDDAGNTSAVLPCAASPATLCYSFAAAGTALQITVSNITAGDPSWAGITI
jgi:hypothetical protein